MSALLPLTLAVLTSLPAPTPASPALVGTTWVLQTVQPAGSAPIMPGARLTRPTLTLTGSGAELTVGGTTGCSPLTGAARLGTAGPLKTATLLLRGVQGGSSQNCTDAALSLREDYLNLLTRVTRSELSGDTLTLSAGKGRLTFRALEARPTAPVNTSLNGAWTALRLTASGRDLPTTGLLNVTFDGPKVTLGGAVGCNALRGTGALLGSPARVTFGPVSSTRMACPPAQAQAETALLSLLRAPLTVTQAGSTLTLSGTGGTLTLTRGPQPTATPAPTPATPDPAATYTLTRVNGAPAPATARPVSLTFRDGRVGGVDGCNNVGAPYALRGTVSGGTVLSLTGPAFTTRIACPETGVNLIGLLDRAPTLTVQGAAGRGQTLTLTVPATADAPAERWEFQAR
ncbi:META domain-containing protein [Deinococcus sp. LM3]|uniref:META domain-containing protein n=1 Tax=Deinococcus sp. LM3 TaxID=1938608 RepID=UPI00099281B9|nr:META domain-containing protein [Deinococcus sp. LM3]OOV13745.1 hypothetical protein BXU09_02485 [Deinococcus sp. LM3]